MRRRVTPSNAATLVPPDELRVPFVERFVTAKEIGQHSFDRDCVLCLRAHSRENVSCSFALLLVTRRRWRDARRAWLDEHGVPAREECAVWPLTRPRWEHGLKHA